MKRTPFSQKRRVKFPMKRPEPSWPYMCLRCGKTFPVFMEYEFKLHNGSCRAKAQLKKIPFGKKANIKFPISIVDPRPALITKATRLRGEIFKHLPCAMCLLLNQETNTATVPHHVLHKGSYDRLRFEIWNLVPLCNFHHSWSDTSEEAFRLVFLLNYLPRHHRYYLNERDNRKPVQQTVESLTKICADLQYYADRPDNAEYLIYEKD